MCRLPVVSCRLKIDAAVHIPRTPTNSTHAQLLWRTLYSLRASCTSTKVWVENTPYTHQTAVSTPFPRRWWRCSGSVSSVYGFHPPTPTTELSNGQCFRAWLEVLIRSLGFPVRRSEVPVIVHQANPDSDGQVDLPTFRLISESGRRL